MMRALVTILGVLFVAIMVGLVALFGLTVGYLTQLQGALS